MSLATLNSGVAMVARSWSDFSSLGEEELDAQIKALCMNSK